MFGTSSFNERIVDNAARFLRTIRGLFSVYTVIGLVLLLLSAGLAYAGQRHRYETLNSCQPYLDGTLPENCANQFSPDGTPTFNSTFNEFYANVASELAGIAITILFIDGISRSLATKQEKKRLKLQMGSSESSIAKEAVRILRIEGWLTTGTVRRARLEKANLEGVNLESADLQAADLDYANLNKANLYSARLKRASLVKVKLRDASLPLADLSNANLLNADLHGSLLDGATLHGAILSGADLSGSSLENARLDEDTILPNQERWHPGIDLQRFTAASHPDYWRSNDPDSPAYQT